jgi:uncharacterized protein (TIGR02452 family)
MSRVDPEQRSSSSQAQEVFFAYSGTPPNRVDTDAIVFVDDVVFFRDDRNDFLSHPFLASVIACAPPNRPNVSPLPRDYDQAFGRRIKRILTCAAENGVTYLVLGAFGCGSRQNNPRDVAGHFRSALLTERLRFCFEEVVFSRKPSSSLRVLNGSQLPTPCPDGMERKDTGLTADHQRRVGIH